MDDIVILIKDKIESMVINNHKDKEYYQNKLSELMEMLKSIQEQNIKAELFNVINNIEKAILLNKEERDKIISEEFNKTKEIVLNLFSKTLQDFQERLDRTNISDFNIISKNENDLILAGSFDFAYYHDVEIIFSDVEFIFCPGHIFSINKFRLATREEITELGKIMNGCESYGIVTCLEDTLSNEKYYIVAQQIKCNWGIVLYYNRENLKPGERIADWVKIGTK